MFQIIIRNDEAAYVIYGGTNAYILAFYYVTYHDYWSTI